MNGRLKRDRDGTTQAAEAKKARCYRVFVENRFKQGTQQCPWLPLPRRFSRPFSCRFPRMVPL